MNERKAIRTRKIIRKTQAAGDETEDELRLLAHDLLLYFGLGRQAVSKVYVPNDYDFRPLCAIIEQTWPEMDSHHQYLNHLDYQKTLLLMNRTPFLDAGKMIFVSSDKLISPISITYTETYLSAETLKEQWEKQQVTMGYVLSKENSYPNWRALGTGHRFYV